MHELYLLGGGNRHEGADPLACADQLVDARSDQTVVLPEPQGTTPWTAGQLGEATPTSRAPPTLPASTIGPGIRRGGWDRSRAGSAAANAIRKG